MGDAADDLAFHELYQKHPIPDPDIFPLGNPGFWITREGQMVRICDMDERHRRNAAAMIDRFIQDAALQCVDVEDAKITNGPGLMALDPFHEKRRELLEGLDS
ncbi:MAG TPA: hypothetical protein VNI57_02585 [Candidatus Saccharimonadales bacterium]|nr:hypothetical protein [Candidatus Saccharimonadales bacterium]